MKTAIHTLTNQDGLASVEVLPLVIVFLVLLAYMLGMYGVTHTAILNSIAARNYAFETFRNRADLVYFRTNEATSEYKKIRYDLAGTRTHRIVAESDASDGGQFPATARRITMGLDSAPEDYATAGPQVHDYSNRNPSGVFGIQDNKRNEQVGVKDVWIMTTYGICINAQCGDR